MALYLDEQEMFTLTLDGTAIETVTLDGVIIARKPEISTQPISSTIKDDESITLTVAADGFGSTLSYQWYLDTDVAISGATASSYTFTPGGTTGSFGFYCRVKGFGGYTQTETAIVVVEVSYGTHSINIAQHPSNDNSIGFSLAGRYGNISPEVVDGYTIAYLTAEQFAWNGKFALDGDTSSITQVIVGYDLGAQTCVMPFVRFNETTLLTQYESGTSSESGSEEFWEWMRVNLGTVQPVEIKLG